MARFQKICLALLIGLMATWTPDAHGQKRYETIQLKTGRTVTGEILEVKPKSIVLLRRLSKGSIKEELPFSRLQPGSLYTALVSALRPLDREAHRRIGDAAYLAGLYATAKRHYKKSSTDEKALTPKLQELVAQCETKDLEKLLKRSTDELVKEKFKRARDLALLAMKRYPAHPQTKTIPEHLQRIKRRHDAARRRDAAMAKTRKEKAAWDAAEKTLGKLEQRIKKAETYESKSLRSTSRLRRSKRLHRPRATRALQSRSLALETTSIKGHPKRAQATTECNRRSRLGDANPGFACTSPASIPFEDRSGPPLLGPMRRCRLTRPTRVPSMQDRVSKRQPQQHRRVATEAASSSADPSR